MGKIKNPAPVKLFTGFIFSDCRLFEAVKKKLVRRFGRVDFESAVFEFDRTAYYNEEMGEGLKRRFLSFERLLPPENISGIKVLTNKIERAFSLNGRRRVNIDPGYMTLGKLALLTTKDFFHRIYLSRGIFAEVTLYYKGKTFQPLDWTYPDYKSKDHIDFFNAVRNGYLNQLRKK